MLITVGNSHTVIGIYEGERISSYALVSALVLELVKGSIVAGRAVVIRAAFGAVTTAVVPSPAIACPPVLATIVAAKSPFVVLLNPMAPTSLVPIVRICSGHTRGQSKRTDQKPSHR